MIRDRLDRAVAKEQFLAEYEKGFRYISSHTEPKLPKINLCARNPAAPENSRTDINVQHTSNATNRSPPNDPSKSDKTHNLIE